MADELKTDELVIVSWGGSYMDAQRDAYWGPWSEAAGVEVIEDTGPQIERFARRGGVRQPQLRHHLDQPGLLFHRPGPGPLGPHQL